MRTPVELALEAHLELRNPANTRAEVRAIIANKVRLAVREAVEEACKMRCLDCKHNNPLVSGSRHQSKIDGYRTYMCQASDIRDHFKKAGY